MDRKYNRSTKRIFIHNSSTTYKTNKNSNIKLKKKSKIQILISYLILWLNYYFIWLEVSKLWRVFRQRISRDAASIDAIRLVWNSFLFLVFLILFLLIKILHPSPERFELSRGNPMYLAGTRLNHSAKATLLTRQSKLFSWWCLLLFFYFYFLFFYLVCNYASKLWLKS